MNLNELNLDDARKKDTFGGATLTSGAYPVDIVKVDKATSQDGATSLNIELKIGNMTRYTTLWMNSKNDSGVLVENEYNSRRLKQLLILLKIEPSTLTEVATDKNWLVNIPQLKGTVGAVLEVTPANTKYNKKEYPKVDIVSFYIIKTMQTVVEFTNNEPAAMVQKEVEKLEKKEYISITQQQNTQQSTPSQFDVGSDLDEDSLPF